jgi:hypothetical protein
MQPLNPEGEDARDTAHGSLGLVGVVTMLGHAWGMDQRTTAGTCGLSRTVQSRYLVAKC